MKKKLPHIIKESEEFEICTWQAGDPVKPMVSFWVQSPKN